MAIQQEAKAVFSVENMTCAGCTSAIEKTLYNVKGVLHVCVDLLEGRATINYDSKICTVSTIKQTIENLNFTCVFLKEESFCSTEAVKALGEELYLSDMSGGYYTTPSTASIIFKVASNALQSVESTPSRTQTLIAFLRNPFSYLGYSAQPGFKTDQALTIIPGVISCRLETCSQQCFILVHYNPKKIGARQLMSAVEHALESTVQLADEDEEEIRLLRSKEEVSCLGKKVFVAFILLALCAFVEYARVERLGGFIQGLVLSMWPTFSLSFVIVYVLGYSLHVTAFKGVRGGVLTMDNLVSLACFVAFVAALGVWVLEPTQRRSYRVSLFFTAAVFASVTFFGRFVERMTRCQILSQVHSHRRQCRDRQTSSTGVSLLIEGPVNEKDIYKERSLQRTPTPLLQIGDLLVILEGEKLPADGIIVGTYNENKKSVLIDEAVLTGESKPKLKKQGNTVRQGCTCVYGEPIIQVTAIGSDTLVGKVTKPFRQFTENRKCTLQTMADKLAEAFIIAISVIAGFTLIAWLLVLHNMDCSNTHAPSFICVSLLEEKRQSWVFKLRVALDFALTVLVVACPCAFGIAAPFAISLASKAAASSGILIKNGRALETGSKINTIVFDKTGVVTSSCPQVSSVFIHPNEVRGEKMMDRLLAHYEQSCLANFAEDKEPGAGKMNLLKWFLLRMEKDVSHHPIARGLISFGEDVAEETKSFFDSLCILSDLQYTAGSGIECKVQVFGNEHHILLGKPSSNMFSDTHESSLLETVAGFEEGANCCGDVHQCSPVVLRVDGKVFAVLFLRHSTDFETQIAVKTLKMKGYDLFLATGDWDRAAYSAAKNLSIPKDHVHARSSPRHKSELVQTLRGTNRCANAKPIEMLSVDLERGCARELSNDFDKTNEDEKLTKLKKKCRNVCMVGDGVNDTLALSEADLGIVIGPMASDEAMGVADVIITQRTIANVRDFLELSKQTVHVIKRNFFWAALFNGMFIPLAAGVGMPFFYCPPHFGPLVMCASTICVLISSWRLTKTAVFERLMAGENL